jgi:hypothetical protein
VRRLVALGGAAVALAGALLFVGALIPPAAPGRCDVPTYLAGPATMAYIRSHHLSGVDCP